ncbi:MAG TPA: hypothetical protein PK349_07810 [Candidatus Hydrogenedentes bacterium]|nr:hypothetical protein [Candidatus Hydrogenedentota bacterium]
MKSSGSTSRHIARRQHREKINKNTKPPQKFIKKREETEEVVEVCVGTCFSCVPECMRKKPDFSGRL